MERKSLFFAAAGFLGLTLLTLLGFGFGPIKVAAITRTTPPTLPTLCPEGEKFFATEAPAGSNQFGPALADPSLEAGQARFDMKLRCDPVFSAVWENIVLLNNSKGSPEELDQRARVLWDNRDERRKVKDSIHSAISQMAVEDRSETYHTLLMQPRGGDVPLVQKTSRPVAMGHVLVLQLKDGRTEYARYICDLQPARPDFPQVPPVQEQPPDSPSAPGSPPVAGSPPPRGGNPPGTSPPTTGPPQTTATTVPGRKANVPATVAPPPTVRTPATSSPTTRSSGNSGVGAPPTGGTTPTTSRPSAPPPVTSSPPTTRVEY